MPRYTDPVLNALFDLQEAAARTHPDPVDVTAAALNGPSSLAEADADHLLRTACAECEPRLERAWSRTAASPEILEEAERWPKAGALRRALDRHVLESMRPAYEAYAARTGLIAPAVKPLTARRRAAAWLRAAGASLHGDVFKDTEALGQLNAGTRGPVAPVERHGELGWFGTNVQLAPVDGGLRVTVHTDRIANVQGRALVLVVFVVREDAPLAVIELGPPSGTWEGRIELPGRELDWEKLRVAIGVVDA
jgi:hypothetical protein